MSIVGFGSSLVTGGFGSSLVQWRLLQNTEERQRTVMMADPVNKADTDYAKAKLPLVGSVDELMSDRRLYTYVMRAFGLEDQINSQALVRKVLESDLSDNASVANRMGDQRFRELAGAFNFGASGSKGVSFTESIAQSYVRAVYEDEVGERNEALQMMLDFTRKLPTKTSWAAVMDDPDMAEVVRIVYGLEKPIGPADAASQATALENTISFAEMKLGPTQTEFANNFFDVWDSNGFPRGGPVRSKVQWQMLMSNYDRELAAVGARYDVKRTISTFEQKITSLGSVDALLKDRNTLNFILKAYDLEDKGVDTNYLRKVLESDPADANSFAAKAGDQEKALALAFGPNNSGAKRRGSPAFINDIVKRYETQSFEVSAGNANEALRLGLYFERKAGGITSWYQVLADKALAEVVRTAFALPAQAAQIDLDRQVTILSSRFDIKKLSDPAEVTKLLERFMMMYDINGNNSNAAASNPVVQMLSGAGRTTIEPSTLMALATLKRW
ncbi:DUF1217 domain-containing protein [Niveispirillum irakense]|uniref:DUF1217 domain-containing protein n=1 Tax=Niveispirillum irakense TaxID=34011 RepID=UPI000402F29C|nr:DUF1217 domain-containing protein [Niveispirillum irakense]